MTEWLSVFSEASFAAIPIVSKWKRNGMSEMITKISVEKSGEE